MSALRRAARLAEREDGATLTAPQRLALARYAALGGDGWRDALRADWMDAGAEPNLHRLRNTHGPAWLSDLAMPDAAPLP